MGGIFVFIEWEKKDMLDGILHKAYENGKTGFAIIAIFYG